jgi:histidyl-tRNA synthetase
MGVEARDWAFPFIQELRERGMSTEMEGDQKSLKSQMRRADKLRAKFVLIVGENELKVGKGVLRNMDTKGQEEIRLDRAAETLLARKEGD